MLNETVLLKEYELAQQSAEHHDKEAWQRAYIMLGIMFVILGFLLSKEHTVHIVLKVFISIIGLFFSMALISLHAHYANLISKKYDICKKIENQLGMQGNHKITAKGDSKNIFIIMMVFICVLWSLYLFTILYYYLYGLR